MVEENKQSSEKASAFMVRYFSLVSIIVISIVGLAVSYVITNRTEDIMFKSYASITASNVKTFISGELTKQDFTKPMTGKRLDQFQSFLDKSVLDEDILKIKLWNPKGVVIYSDDHRLIGKQFPIKEDLEESLDGEATSEIVNTNDEAENVLDRQEFDKAIETYVPVMAKEGSKVLGSYEVYLSLKPVLSAVSNVRAQVFSGLFALYILLVLIVRWASSMLLRQYRKLMEYSSVMQAKALTDELSGLYNRRFFDSKINEEFRRALRYDRPLSMIMIDIDHFKKVNDKLGHMIGDEVLAKTGAIIKANLRKIDFAARYGGEEFAIIMPETEGANAYVAAERLRKAYLTILDEYRDEDLDLTISLGVAEYPSSAATSEELVSTADIALYYSKNNGRNAAHFYNNLPKIDKISGKKHHGEQVNEEK